MIDKENEQQILQYKIPENKISNLSILMRSDIFKTIIKPNGIYDNLELIGGPPKNIVTEKMATQKLGNCYAKEVEAGIKVALWSRERGQEGSRIKWDYRGLIPHQSVTLKVHELYTEALIQRLKAAGYGDKVEKIIRNNFDKYKLSKYEISIHNWEEKQNATIEELKANEKKYGFIEKIKIRSNKKSVPSSE